MSPVESTGNIVHSAIAVETATALERGSDVALQQLVSSNRRASVVGYPAIVNGPFDWAWADRGQVIDRTFEDLVELLEQLELLLPCDVVIQAVDGLDRALRLGRLIGQHHAAARIHIVALNVTAQQASAARSGGVRSIHDVGMGYGALMRVLGENTSGRPAVRPTQSSVGTLTIDFSRRRVTVRGALLSLTKTEFEILRCLADSPGVLVDRRSLIANVWGEGWFGAPNVLDTHLANLRAKLLAAGHRAAIVTVHGSGFYFEPQAWGMAEAFASVMAG